MHRDEKLGDFLLWIKLIEFVLELKKNSFNTFCV